MNDTISIKELERIAYELVIDMEADARTPQDPEFRFGLRQGAFALVTEVKKRLNNEYSI